MNMAMLAYWQVAEHITSKYMPEPGVEVSTFVVNSDSVQFKLDLRERIGDDMHYGDRKDLYEGCDGAIVVTSGKGGSSEFRMHSLRFEGRSYISGSKVAHIQVIEGPRTDTQTSPMEVISSISYIAYMSHGVPKPYDGRDPSAVRDAVNQVMKSVIGSRTLIWP
jgi:hypothetical protein